MGNSDLVFVVNNRIAFVISGGEYNDHKGAFSKAIEKFDEKAKKEIAYWFKVKEENPEMVDPDFDIVDYWELKKIEVYDMENE